MKSFVIGLLAGLLLAPMASSAGEPEVEYEVGPDGVVLSYYYVGSDGAHGGYFHAGSHGAGCNGGGEFYDYQCGPFP